MLTGRNVWGDGNILLGGAGSDLIEGRGADDIIDGDSVLQRPAQRPHGREQPEIGTARSAARAERDDQPVPA